MNYEFEVGEKVYYRNMSKLYPKQNPLAKEILIKGREYTVKCCFLGTVLQVELEDVPDYLFVADLFERE